MTKKIIYAFIVICISCINNTSAQQQERKSKKSKQSNNIENKNCEPELNADTAAIDLRTGKPKNPPTDTTNLFKNKQK